AAQRTARRLARLRLPRALPAAAGELRGCRPRLRARGRSLERNRSENEGTNLRPALIEGIIGDRSRVSPSIRSPLRRSRNLQSTALRWANRLFRRKKRA